MHDGKRVQKIRKESFHPFNSLFELVLLTKIDSILNSRPIWGSETGLVTIQDLLTPRITNGEELVMSQNDLVTKNDMYRAAFKIFSDEVVDGNLTKTGKKAYTGTPVMETGAVVLVIFPSKCKWRYGLVVRPISNYKYEIRMAEKGNCKKLQVHDRYNLVKLFMPCKNEQEN